MSAPGPPSRDQCALQRRREALHERETRAQAAGEAAGVTREMGANPARDLPEDAGQEVPVHL